MFLILLNNFNFNSCPIVDEITKFLMKYPLTAAGRDLAIVSYKASMFSRKASSLNDNFPTNVLRFPSLSTRYSILPF